MIFRQFLYSILLYYIREYSILLFYSVLSWCGLLDAIRAEVVSVRQAQQTLGGLGGSSKKHDPDAMDVGTISMVAKALGKSKGKIKGKRKGMQETR